MRIFLAIIICFSPLRLFAANDDFQSGVSAFKQQDYPNALRYFQQAETEGIQSEQLTFNLGSTYYKLQQYSKAESYFRPLTKLSEWRDIALFNLGLISEKQKNDKLAQYYFLQVYQYSENQPLQQLASRKLNQISDVWIKKKALYSASLEFGNDDNAIAFPDELQSNASAVADNFLEFYLFSQQKIQLDGESESYLQGFVYNKSYQDLNSLDVSVIGASLFRQPSSRPHSQGFSIVSSRIDNDIAYHQIQLLLGQEISILEGLWQVEFEPSYYFGGDNYSQLDGWRHRVSGERSWQHDAFTIGLSINAEINRRKNLEVGDSRYSYSPFRYGIETTWNWYYSSKLNFSAALEFVNSRYTSKNKLEDLDGNVKNKQRRGMRWQINLGADYLIDQHWSAIAKIEYLNNDENFDLYSYRRNQISVGTTFNY